MGSNKLVITTPNDLEIKLARDFDFPRELVFEAWTNAEHVSKWWWPDCVEMVSVDIDLRVGGGFRFVGKSPDGAEHPFVGTYHQVQRPELLVHTFVYDLVPFKEHPATVTVTFDDLGGKTRMTEIIAHKTKEARDGHLQSGMDTGAAQAMDQLDNLLEGLQVGATA